MNERPGPRRPDPNDPRRGDWRDRWSDEEAGAGPSDGRGGDGYADATERLPVTGDGRATEDFEAGYGGYDDLEGDGPDPVRDFFAAHRAQVQEHAADDLNWQHIRREARVADGSRRRAWLTGAGIAASLAVVGLVLSQAFKGGDEPPAPAPPPTITTDGTALTGEPERTTEAPTGALAPTTPVSPPATPETTTSPSTTDAGEEASGSDTAATTGEPAPTEPTEEPVVTPPTIQDGWANPPMGMGDRLASVRQVSCDSTPEGLCSVLYLSEDGGESWGEPIDLDALGLTSVDRTDDLVWGWGPGGLKRSEDLGATWTDVPHRGAQVLRVNTWAEEMMVVTGDCSGQTCTDVEVTIVDPATQDASDGQVSALGEMEAAPGLPRRTQQAIYLSVPGPVTAESSLWRIPVDGGEASTITPSEHCSAEGAVATAVTGVARSEDDLLMACQSTDAGQEQVELLRSADGASSWSPVSSVEVTAPRMCGLSSGDGRDIILAVGGGVWVSHDEGASFARTVEHEAPPGAECVISGVVYGAGTTYVARALAGEGPDNPAAYWRSVDAGDTWRYVVVD